jgi:hypothetical protein
MNIIIAYRARGSSVYTHLFRVTADQWPGFYRHARLWRKHGEYARVVGREYVSIL